METIILSCLIEILIIAVIWWRVRERAKPFLVTGALIVVEMVALAFASNVPALKQLDVFIGNLPGPMIWIVGLAIGAATSWAGWQAGKRPAATTVAAQPA